SESARAFLKRFPMTVTIQELNGNELFAYMDENLPTDAQRATKIHTGDVKLFGRDCPMLFYKDFATAYSYTSLGKVDDAEALAQAWKEGNKEVIFTY
ncbi:MAG: cyclophilin-like fold protein, partial [[Clostridium] innocuum]